MRKVIIMALLMLAPIFSCSLFNNQPQTIEGIDWGMQFNAQAATIRFDAFTNITDLANDDEFAVWDDNVTGVRNITWSNLQADFDHGSQAGLTDNDHTQYVLDAGDTMTGILVLDDTTIQIQEGADTMSISVPTLTADRAVTFPDAAGEVSLLGQAITSSEITDGELVNADMANDALDADKIVGDSTDDDDLDVAAGGTGVSTLTDGGVLLGSGTGDVTAMAVLADGAIVIGDGTTDPVALTAFTSSTGDVIHEAGGLEADVSAYSGLVGINSGSTSEVDTESELETHLGSLDVVTVTSDDVTSANVATFVSDEIGTGRLVMNDSSSFTTKIQTPTIELGHASDTTLARSSAGIMTVEGAEVSLLGNSIDPSELNDSHDPPADEECLTYESTGTQFEWQSCGSGSGDVTDVGDCTTGACLDGTSDGGTYIRLYDGDSNYTEINNGDANQSADLKWVLPNSNGTAGQVLEIASVASDTINLEWDDDGGGSDTNSVKEYWWSAASMLPISNTSTVAPLSLDTGSNASTLVRAFNDSLDECAGVNFKVPSDVTSGSTVTFRCVSYSSTATSGNFILDFRQHEKSEGESWDSTVTSTETAAADAVQGTVDQVTVTTWTETLSNLGWAANDEVDGYFCRDADNGSDTLSGDLSVKGCGVEIPRN